MAVKYLKELKWDALLTGIFYVLLGFAALLIPETMEKLLGYLLGVVLIIAGAVAMIGYLLRDARQNFYHDDFHHGLLSIAAGILVLLKVDVIIAMIPFLLGALILVSGCSKLQAVIDMKRMNYGNWVAMLIAAAVNVLFGILLMCKPFSSAVVLARLLGLGLILSGASDCFITCYFARKIRSFLAGVQAVDSTFVEVTDTKGSGRNAEENIDKGAEQ